MHVQKGAEGPGGVNKPQHQMNDNGTAAMRWSGGREWRAVETKAAPLTSAAL